MAKFKWHMMADEEPTDEKGKYLLVGKQGGMYLARGYTKYKDFYIPNSRSGYMEFGKVIAWAVVPPLEVAEEPQALRSCPFCGAVDEVMTAADFWAGAIPAEAVVDHQVGCTVCDIWTPSYDTEAEAIAAWNRRADG